jgi:hypothetical protein
VTFSQHDHDAQMNRAAAEAWASGLGVAPLPGEATDSGHDIAEPVQLRGNGAKALRTVDAPDRDLPLTSHVSQVWNSGNSGNSESEDELGDSAPRLLRGSDLEPPQQIQYLVQGLLPQGDVAALFGAEGIGKSLWWVLVAAHVTTGKGNRALGIREGEPRDVLVIATEDHKRDVVVPRLQVAGADTDRVLFIAQDTNGEGICSFPRDMHLVHEAAEDYDLALVVVDAWLDTVHGSISIRDPHQARVALNPWTKAAHSTMASILLLGHSNRDEGATSLRSRVGATGTLRQKVRSMIYAAQPPERPGVLYVGGDKANNQPGGSAVAYKIEAVQKWEPGEFDDGTIARLTVEGDTGATMPDHYARWQVERKRAEHPSAADQAWTWLHDFLTEHGGECEAAAAKTAAKQAGHNPRQLAPLLREHGGQVAPGGQQGAWVYRLAQTSLTSQTSSLAGHGKCDGKSQLEATDRATDTTSSPQLQGNDQRNQRNEDARK